MTTKERYRRVLEIFSHEMPVAETELHYDTPFHLLVAVILSAQCTDKRINMITPALFEAYPTPADMAVATQEEIYGYIRSVSYPNNKARSLLGAARMLVEEFGGELPSDIDLSCVSRSRPEDCQRNARRSMEPCRHGCRHPRVPSKRTHRPDNRQQDSPRHKRKPCVPTFPKKSYPKPTTGLYSTGAMYARRAAPTVSTAT